MCRQTCQTCGGDINRGRFGRQAGEEADALRQERDAARRWARAWKAAAKKYERITSMDDCFGGEACPICGEEMDWQRCESCDEGFVGHDCGEDCCCCLDPEDNIKCDICDGKGGYWQCRNVPHAEKASER